MTTQLGLFGDNSIDSPEPRTEVRLGKRSVQYPLHRKRREACARLGELLEELEGKDIYIGSYEAGGQHFWIGNLKLCRLQVEGYPHTCKRDAPRYIPSVIILRGSRSGYVRVFTDYLVAVREQEYQGYWLYLLDFRNGFWESRLDKWKSHYACLTITRFKD